MKWLAFSDAHLKKFSDPRREKDQQHFFELLMEVVVVERIELVVFIGDWYNSKSYLHAALCNFSIDFLKQLSTRCDLIFVAGNHDFLYPDKTETTLEPFSQFGSLYAQPGVYKRGNITFDCLPYTRDVEKVRSFCGKSGSSILLAHIELDQMRASRNWLLKTEMKKSDLSLSSYVVGLTGHVHWRQQIDNLICIGSPYEMDFSDAGSLPRGLHVFEDCELSKFIPLDLPRHFIITYSNSIPLPQGEHYIKIVDVPADEVDKVLRDCSTFDFREVVVIPEVGKTLEKDEKFFSINSAIDEYVERVCPDQLDKDELKEMGKRYLSVK
jgi:hypothetical protein